jgi:hypothetical protein
MMQRGGREDAEESAHWTKEVEGVPLPTLMPPRKTGIMLSPVSIELAFGIPVIMTPGSLQRITRVFGTTSRWDSLRCMRSFEHRWPCLRQGRSKIHTLLLAAASPRAWRLHEARNGVTWWQLQSSDEVRIRRERVRGVCSVSRLVVHVPSVRPV